MAAHRLEEHLDEGIANVRVSDHESDVVLVDATVGASGFVDLHSFTLNQTTASTVDEPVVAAHRPEEHLDEGIANARMSDDESDVVLMDATVGASGFVDLYSLTLNQSTANTLEELLLAARAKAKVGKEELYMDVVDQGGGTHLCFCLIQS